MIITRKSLPLIFCFQLIIIVTTLHAQLIPPLAVPQPSSDMPEWAAYLYTQPVNMLRLDSAYQAYYQSHPFEKNNYTRYYKRYRKTYAPFMLNNGDVRPVTTADILRSESDSKANSLQSPLASTWNAIGPFETYVPPQGASTLQLCPWQVNVYAFDIAPSNANILYAVSETGGFFKSTDKGKQWTMLEPGVYSSSDAVAIHPTNPNIVYVGIAGGMLRTGDGGATWKSIWKVQDLWCYDIEVSRENNNTIFAATNQGFYRSTDAGANWTRSSDNTHCDMETHPTNRNMVYTLRYNSAVKRYEFWKSTDGGINFTLKSNGWLNTVGSEGGGRMTVTPASANRIYVVLLGDSSRPYILRSDDAGESWRVTARGNTDSLKMNNGQGYYDLSIAVSHTNADKLIVGTQTTYRSDNGGFTFSIVGGYGGSFPIHPDLQEVRCLGGDTWIATDGGMTYSTDCFTDTKNAEARVVGLNGADFWGFDSGWNEDVLVGGRYHNGNTAWHESYGTKFFRMGGGEAATGYVNPIENRRMYFSDIGGWTIPTNFNGALVQQSVGKFPNESYYYMEYSEMTWDPRCYNTVWIGKGNTLWRSKDGARTYDSVWASTDNDAVLEHIEIVRSNPDVMYVSQRSNAMRDGKIWKTTDGGKSWRALTPFPNTSGGERRVMQISVSGTDEDVIIAALLTGGKANKVFKSINGGNGWQNLTTTTIENAGLTDMIHQLGTNGGIYLGAQNGKIYYRNASMSDWEEIGKGLPFAHYTRAFKAFYRDNKLRSGSSLGIWETNLYEHSKPIAQPSVDKLSTSCERDTFYFDDYSVLERANAKWSWSFPGAYYVSDSTARNPKVLYNTPGVYPVTLTVSNDYGSSTKTVTNYITIQPLECGVDIFADKALDLSASNDFAALPPLPQMRDAKAFTISAWLKLDSLQYSFSQILSNWSSDVGFSLGFAFLGYRQNTNLTFYWKNVPYQLTSPFNLPMREWVHIAISVAQDSVTLYMNGEPWVYKNANANFRDFDLSQTPWELGGGLPGQGGNYRGQIEELKIYNRALSTQEIREAMHLISKEDSPPLAYFQFNEKQTERFFNRTGAVHLLNGGGSTRVSTAPVARGSSYRQGIAGGNWDFGSTGVSLNSNNATQREVVISRLDALPDSLPTGMNRLTEMYWILHSWGSNKALAVDSLIFANIGALSVADAGLPSTFKLFKRTNANEHLNSWKQVAKANSADTLLRRVAFGSDTNAVGQYIIGTSGTSVLEVGEEEQPIFTDETLLAVFPHPVHQQTQLSLNAEKVALPATMYLVNSIGQRVMQQRIASPLTQLSFMGIADGIYTLQLHTATGVLSRKLVIVR